MNNKTKAIVAVTALACLTFSGTVFAYLTATDSKTNTFTIGNVSAELTEPNFTASDEIAFPNYKYTKDPTVTNTGNTDALVFIEYTIPMATVSIVNSSTKKAGDPARAELFVPLNSSNAEGVNSDWVSIKDATTVEEGGQVVGKKYYYAYNGILEKDDSTTPIFNKVKVVNYANGDIEDGEVEIEVDAKVIQADNLHMSDTSVSFTELKDAYSYFVKQED